jgi:hypothetical protein
MKWSTVRGLVVATSFGLIACGQTATEEPLAEVAQPLTAPTQVNSFALLASGRVRLGDRATFSGGNIGVLPGTGDSVTVGSAAHVGIGSSTIGQRIVLKDRAVVGDLFATTVVPGANASYASLSAYAAPPALPSIAMFSAGTAPLTVNTPTTLAPGNFGQVTINSTLTLSGGTYQFQNLTLSTNAVLQASAASVVRVAGKISGASANFVRIGPTGTQTAANLRLIVAGANDTNGGVTLGTDARLTALVVSRASVTVGDRFNGKGAIAASNFTGGNDATFALQTGFECTADSACDDGQSCTTDSCVDAKCVHSALPEGAMCSDDGDSCTADSCASGSCIHTPNGTCPALAPIPPRKMPTPPSGLGCFWYTLNGWESIPCTPVQEVIARDGVPVVPPGLATPYVAQTPNPTTSIRQALVPPTTSTPLPFVFAQAEMMFPVIGSVADVFPNPPSYSGCRNDPTVTPNMLSAQLNTNKFVMSNGHNGVVQFAIVSAGLTAEQIHMCIWQIDATTSDYASATHCVTMPPPPRSTPLQPFDFVNIAGFIDAAGALNMEVELSWVPPGWPKYYQVSWPDTYGLANNWLHVDGAPLGGGDCSQAQFTDTSLVTRMMVSTCRGVTSANSSTAGCPAATLQPNVTLEYQDASKTVTGETNNLREIGVPQVSYPNPYLAVTNVTATTTGSCLDPKHLYVRDYALDSGATPSNPNHEAFWDSPDIFLVPAGSMVDVNSTPAQSLITADTDFDIYVRVNNDLGCASMTGAKAKVYLADPAALSTIWNPVTTGYQAGASSGTVTAGGKALLGPFRYHSPPTGFGDGHKCLIASIIADGEAAVSNDFDAPNSNQVAQRNVQLENCAFPLTNATGTNGDVEITLNVAPPETLPSLTTLPAIAVSFDDLDSAWYNVWAAQPENGTAYSLTHIGTSTTVRLGKAAVTLHSVPLANGQSRTAHGNLSLPSGTSQTALNLQTTLRSSTTGAVLAPVNGGSCKATGAGPVP